jgi:hypothetical protein
MTTYITKEKTGIRNSKKGGRKALSKKNYNRIEIKGDEKLAEQQQMIEDVSKQLNSRDDNNTDININDDAMDTTLSTYYSENSALNRGFREGDSDDDGAGSDLDMSGLSFTDDYAVSNEQTRQEEDEAPFNPYDYSWGGKKKTKKSKKSKRKTRKAKKGGKRRPRRGGAAPPKPQQPELDERAQRILDAIPQAHRDNEALHRLTEQLYRRMYPDRQPLEWIQIVTSTDNMTRMCFIEAIRRTSPDMPF